MVVLTSLVSWSKKDLERKPRRKSQSKDETCVVPGTLHFEHSFHLKPLSNAERGIYLLFLTCDIFFYLGSILNQNEEA